MAWKSPRWFGLTAASSTTAGFIAAGLVETARLLGAPQSPGLVAALALPLGLYGLFGLFAGGLLGLATGVVHSRTGGWHTLIETEERDRKAAGALLAVVFAAMALACAASLGHAAVVAKMHNRHLALIATFGITLAAAVPAILVGLGLWPLADRMASMLPRLRLLGRTGALLGGLIAGGLLAFALALGRSDWRVLDLGPLGALGLVLLFGVPHFVFWHVWSKGKTLAARVPLFALRAGTVAVIAALAISARGLPDASPVWTATEERGLGLRMALSIARRLADGDGDGFSARYGGGDCDDTRADTYPGAEDAPGDGIDQNCEGGDATAAAAAPETPAVPVEKRSGTAFSGNILIVSIDSLRADRLGINGYGRPKGRSLTPNLDALAQRGTFFKRAWSHAPNTPRSFPAFLTSRYPSEVAWAQKTANYSPLLPENRTFFEDLAQAGLAPLGFHSHFYFSADRGLNQGFKEWNNVGAGSIAESNKDIAAPRIVPRIIERLTKAAAAKERFVLWTHLFEPHSSYLPHAEFPLSEKGVAGLEEKYDFEIAFVDGWVGKLMAALEKSGLAKNTAVVVFADHGEAWGEHKRYFHGTDLTEEQLRVPLIVALPGAKAQIVEQNVALVDVGPTLVDLVGLAPAPTFRGRSLLPLIEGKPLPERPVFAELLPATAWPKHETIIVDGDWKLTHKITERRFELHDLKTDPGQQHDRFKDPAAASVLEGLRKKLLDFEEGRRAPAP